MKIVPTLFKSSQQPKPASLASSPTDQSPRSRLGPLTAFAVSPDGVRFETQLDEERIILFMRQHIIVNVLWVFTSVLLILAPSFLFPFLLGQLSISFPLPPIYLVVATLFWYLATFGFILVNFLQWFFNIYIVTDERVVDIDFIHLLYKEFSEARLSRVQDITYKTGGIFATIFDYGNVLIQTAGELPNFEFISVPHPAQVVRILSGLVEKSRDQGI